MLARPQVNSVHRHTEQSQVNKFSRQVLIRPSVSPDDAAREASRYFSSPTGRAQRSCFNSSVRTMFEAIVKFIEGGRHPPFFVAGRRDHRETPHAYLQAFRWSAFYGFYHCAWSATPATSREFFRAIVAAFDAATAANTAESRERGAVVVLGMLSTLGEHGIQLSAVRTKLAMRMFRPMVFWRENTTAFTRDICAEVELIIQSGYTYAPAMASSLSLLQTFINGDGPFFRVGLDADYSYEDSDGNSSGSEEVANEPSSGSVGSDNSIRSDASDRCNDNSVPNVLVDLGIEGLTRSALGLTLEDAGVPAAAEGHEAPRSAPRAIPEPRRRDQFGAVDITRMPYMFLCPITQCEMKEPVTAMDGYNYEKSSIQRWLRRKAVSPMTRMPMEARLIANIPLRNAIAEYKAGMNQNIEP